MPMKIKTQEELTRGWPAKWAAPTVLVRCTVFNHGKFIERCLQGFLLQETNFPFEVFVHDDASTDESADIIRRYAARYPLILKPVYESENQCSKKDGSFFRTTWQPVIQGGHKYIALCEGDDYWTDPKKLQKQVEYMEAHPGCAGCFHERVTCDKDGRVKDGSSLPDEMKHALTGDEIAAWTFPCPPTCTVLYRREVLITRPERLNNWVGGDRANALWAAYFHGTVDWLPGVAPSVYRIHSGGVSQGLDELHLILQDHAICRQTIASFPVSRKVRRTIHGKMEEDTFRAWWKWHACESEEKRRAVRDLIRNNMIAWPALRWQLWARQAGYCLNQGRWRAWHGLVMGIKHVLPAGMYERGRRLLQKRNSGGRA